MDPEGIIISGNQKGKMLIITNEDYEEEGCKKLLDGIRAAINSNEENTCIIQLNDALSMRVSALPHFSSFTHIIILGHKAKSIGLNIENNAYVRKSINGQNLIFSSGLSELILNVDYKKTLWGALKLDFILE